MFTPALTPLTGAFQSSGTAQSRASQTTGFAGVLAEAKASLSGVSSSSQDVDPVDEENALLEEFRILAALSTGQVDPGILSASESKAGAKAPGPARQEVERLKEVIRRLMRGGLRDLEIDPKTGKPRVIVQGNNNGESSEPSLADLISSLPAGIQNLLKRAFPGLDQVRQDEAKKEKHLL